jgi:hypothetical protein
MVYEILDVGEANALSPDYLRVTLGLSSNRAVQRVVESERALGLVILSSTTPPGGYYRAGSAYELRRFIKTLTHRGERTLAAINGATELLKQFEDGSENEAREI